MAGLNDELDEELRLAAEEAKTDGVDIRNYLPPEEPSQLPTPADRLFLMQDLRNRSNKELTTEDVLGDDLDPEQVPMKEVEFAFVDQTEDLINAFEEIKQNISTAGGTCQGDIKSLASVYPEYLAQGQSFNHYTKSPTKTLHNQTVAKVDNLIMQQHNLKKEFLAKAATDTLVNVYNLSSLVVTVYTKPLSGREMVVKQYARNLKQKDFDKYPNLCQGLQQVYDKNLALVILLNMLTAGYSISTDSLFSLTDPVYVATHLQEPSFNVCSLVKFIGSEHEKNFFTITMPVAIDNVKDKLINFTKQEVPFDGLVVNKQAQQQVLGVYNILSDMNKVYALAVQLIKTAGSN